MRILEDKIAIVTGGGRGIGRSIACALASAGAVTVLAARNPDEIARAAELIREGGGRALAFPADVTRPADVDSLVRHTLGNFGRVDILVNNSGVQGPIGPLVDNDPAAWIETIHVNLIGTVLCSRAVLPGMIRQHSGKIVNLSGGGATAARPRFSAYAASKAAVVRLTETLAEEVREHNIQVNSIAPGSVATGMYDAMIAAGESADALVQPDAERAAALVVFLASAASNRLTGKLIAALHDGWEHWNETRICEVMSGPWLTLRRVDAHTLKPLIPSGA